MQGKYYTEESKRKIGEANSGKTQSLEMIEKRTSHTRINKETELKIVESFNNGQDIIELREKFKVINISRILKRNGINITMIKQQRNIRILKMIEDGEKINDVADKFNLSLSSIYKIINKSE
jgi:Mor family transcriptional regulator